MKTPERQHQWQSPEEMRDAAELFRIGLSEIDPEAGKIDEYITENVDQIWLKIKNDTDFWNWVFEKWQKENIPRARLTIIMEDENFVYDYGCTILNRCVLVAVNIYSKQWAEERTEFLDKAFNTEGLDKKEEGCPVGLLAKRLGVGPMSDSRIKNDFNPSGIVDGLGKKIDFRIRELVRLLNLMGLETTGSCGGHRIRRLNPYLHFKGNHLHEVVSLLQEWGENGGIEYNIFPLGFCGEDICVNAPDNCPLESAQKDIDDLTDWLESKIPDFEKIKLSLPEKIMQVRRRVKKRLRL